MLLHTNKQQNTPTYSRLGTQIISQTNVYGIVGFPRTLNLSIGTGDNDFSVTDLFFVIRGLLFWVVLCIGTCTPLLTFCNRRT